jgi:hypothetical protein
MKNDIAVSNPQWKNDQSGVLVHNNGRDKIKRIGTTWHSLPKNTKVKANEQVPMLMPETLPHLYIEE